MHQPDDFIAISNDRVVGTIPDPKNAKAASRPCCRPGSSGRTSTSSIGKMTSTVRIAPVPSISIFFNRSSSFQRPSQAARARQTPAALIEDVRAGRSVSWCSRRNVTSVRRRGHPGHPRRGGHRVLRQMGLAFAGVATQRRRSTLASRSHARSHLRDKCRGDGDASTVGLRVEDDDSSQVRWLS